MIAVQRHDDISPRLQQAGLVSAAIPADLLMKHAGAELPCDFRRAVRGIIVHDDALVDERGYAGEHLSNALLFVQARYDYCNPMIFIHGC